MTSEPGEGGRVEAEGTAPSTEPIPFERLEVSARARALHAEVLGAPPSLCAERAALVTRFFRKHADRSEPMVVQKAEALAYVLEHKGVRINPRERLVGCYTAQRVGGNLYPELHGVAMLEDLLDFERRTTNPLAISRRDRLRLLADVAPYWALRSILTRGFGVRADRTARFLADQFDPKVYLVNEAGGVAHFVPNYAALLSGGTTRIRQAAIEHLGRVEEGRPEVAFLQAVTIACDGIDKFADGYRAEAEKQARDASGDRREDLLGIVEACARVPRSPARTLQDALQAIIFGQIALNLESLDHAVSPGRLDQILWPYYRDDLAAGRLDRQDAFELLCCFTVKLCEVVPVFSRRLTRFHGGMFNGQVVVVGGVTPSGEDGTNELSHLFLEVMERLRTRQPNYHARLHTGSPADYRQRVARVLAAGAASPAVYNDDVIVPIVRDRGVTDAHARDYATVGCVEPTPAGRSFMSTDAALFNLPLCLELALNEGRQFGARRRMGVKTPPAAECSKTDDLLGLFRIQLEHQVGRLLGNLAAIEAANARLHPTPLSSMLIDGCVDRARDVTAGGARYNGSGIQGVGAPEVADSLAAVEAVVFRGKHATMQELVDACRTDFACAEELQARLRQAPRFGNDDPAADRYLVAVMERFAACLEGRANTRGGRYVAGYYSVTSHIAFGDAVGALPSGRVTGEPFSSGISPGSGAERQGPTASIQSVAHLPVHLAPNGINYNLQLPPWIVSGCSGDGPSLVQGLIDGGFAAGCMQMQINVLDPKILIEARDNPGRHPGLLVRVSGYSAYFDDLSPRVKQEIIDRTFFGASSPEDRNESQTAAS